jgi:hypothetical protein
MKMKMNMGIVKKIAVVVVGVIAAQELLPFYFKAKQKVITTVKGA